MCCLSEKGAPKWPLGTLNHSPELFMENSENKILKKKSHKFLISDQSYVTKQGAFLPCPTQGHILPTALSVAKERLHYMQNIANMFYY